MSHPGPRQIRPWDQWAAQGVVADLDGVLLDSTEVLRAQWRWWAHRIGANGEAVASFAAGRRPVEVVARFAPAHDRDAELDLLARRNEVLLRACRRVGGVRRFVTSLPADRFAVVTGLDRAAAQARFGRARITPPDVLVTGDQLDRGRPDPSGHALAARLLGLDPAELIAIESTGVGLAAAGELGMTSLLLGPSAASSSADGVVRLSDLGRLRASPSVDGVVLQATREPARWT
ncbi:MAG: HAD-IA family hydrolase [Nitriliruptoraceae bacterium]|nr:HAD-IA family hydrolase [Nitriliruptoraceae bacterium]